MNGLLKKIFKGDKTVWLIYFALVGISLVEVFSASSTLTYKTVSHWVPIRGHAVLLAGGFVALLLTMRINLIKMERVRPYVYVGTAAVLLLATLAFGQKLNGASRSFVIFGVSIQASEIAKVLLLIVTAQLLRDRDENGRPTHKAFMQISICTIIICALIGLENLSTAIMLFLVISIVMAIGYMSLWKIVKLWGACFVFVLLLVGVMHFKLMPDNKLLHRYATWENRFVNFFGNKSEKELNLDDHRQSNDAQVAIATSNFIGKGPGNSTQRDFLSQAYSDFIFAIIIEEFGLWGAIFVPFCYLLFYFRCSKIGAKGRDDFIMMLSVGIGVLFIIQALFNMSVAVGIAPVTGQPLPLISRGGSSVIICSIMVGLVLACSLNQDPIYNIEEKTNENSDNHSEENKEEQLITEKHE